MSKALTVGPQRVRHRDQVVVVLSEADYQRLTSASVTLKDYLLNGPNLSDLDRTRDSTPTREFAR
jgi:PHD/YefM family antitoxin component YafN of YafNO toxin-antitoxin module